MHPIARTGNEGLQCVLKWLYTKTFDSAAYYVIFLSYDNPLTPEGIDDSVLNPMPTPTESIMAMFLMSVNTFTDYYTAFDKTSHTLVAKVR